MNKARNARISTMVRRIGILLIIGAWLAQRQALAVGTWTNVVAHPPDNNGVQLLLLLSDGTVMAQRADPANNSWYRLAPDPYGSYVNGSWSNMASMHYPRLFYSSAVLRDGRVLVAGGELPKYPAPSGSTAEVYDPRNNGWTEISVPPGLICTNCTSPAFSDSGCVVLANGNVMIAPVQPAIWNNTVLFDPATDSFSRGPSSLQWQNEATWVKLPDDSILTIDPTRSDTLLNTSERYIPALNIWIQDAQLKAPMYNAAQEIGPGLLLPDGRAFFIGGMGHTALYTPTGTTEPGTWTQGPDLPTGTGWDNPGAMMVNGKVLFMAGCTPWPGTSTNYCYYEFDPTINYPTGAITSAGSWGDIDYGQHAHRMPNLPDGTGPV
ncbi:MAG: kelch repeat-containing protein, partial [bacterium]